MMSFISTYEYTISFRLSAFHSVHLAINVLPSYVHPLELLWFLERRRRFGQSSTKSTSSLHNLIVLHIISKLIRKVNFLSQPNRKLNVNFAQSPWYIAFRRQVPLKIWRNFRRSISLPHKVSGSYVRVGTISQDIRTAAVLVILRVGNNEV